MSPARVLALASERRGLLDHPGFNRDTRSAIDELIATGKIARRPFAFDEQEDRDITERFPAITHRLFTVS